MEGFATITGALPEEVYQSAVVDGEFAEHNGTRYGILLDLMDANGQIDEKAISLEQAAQILRIPQEVIFQTARQTLARIDDEDAAYIAALTAKRTA